MTELFVNIPSKGFSTRQKHWPGTPIFVRKVIHDSVKYHVELLEKLTLTRESPELNARPSFVIELIIDS